MTTMSPEVMLSSGSLFDYDRLNVQDVSIDDIAHALSNICRFGGHSRQFYSVAEHSIRVADILAVNGADQATVYTGLMHDAVEALVGDMPAPLKQLLPDYRKLEKKLAAELAWRFGFSQIMPQAVKAADIEALAWEFPRLMKDPAAFVWPYEIKPQYPDPMEAVFFPRSPTNSKQTFLLYFDRFAPKGIK